MQVIITCSFLSVSALTPLEKRFRKIIDKIAIAFIKANITYFLFHRKKDKQLRTCLWLVVYVTKTQNVHRCLPWNHEKETHALFISVSRFLRLNNVLATCCGHSCALQLFRAVCGELVHSSVDSVTSSVIGFCCYERAAGVRCARRSFALFYYNEFSAIYTRNAIKLISLWKAVVCLFCSSNNVPVALKLQTKRLIWFWSSNQLSRRWECEPFCTRTWRSGTDVYTEGI